mmetsp:Transcript_736/g.1511  ORF Transcript_736/g.1511 Transcript_736/m.1511 type:complete len:87 (-) Transcript_736:923-1183(-)
MCDYEKMSSRYIYKGILPLHKPKSGKMKQGRLVRSTGQPPNTTQVVLSREEVSSLSPPHHAFGESRQIPVGSTGPVLQLECNREEM